MAVTKIWAIHDSVSRVVDYCTNPSKTKLSDLEQVLLYAADKEKTLDEGEQQYAVTGIGCRAESAAREMAAVQKRFGKAGVALGAGAADRPPQSGHGTWRRDRRLGFGRDGTGFCRLSGAAVAPLRRLAPARLPQPGRRHGAAGGYRLGGIHDR